jgi:NAD(P)-dependent dehydrogenase (short-subunit alcohol dehydrogenase family)
MFNLTNKVAVVTGGAGIIGEQFCNGLAQFGADVAIIDTNTKKAADLASFLSAKFGIKSISYSCDVSNPISVKSTVTSILNDFSRIDILHNNAATKSNDLESYFASFEDYSLDQWNQIMSVNINGMFLMAQSVGKSMVDLGIKGSIIQTSSIYGIMAPDNRIYEGSNYLNRSINTPAVYSVSKAAVVGLTKYLSTYWANQGIRVNTLTPGGVFSGQNKEFQDRYSSRIPLHRMANASEIVGALLYLASDASSYVTGHNLIVDGGLHVW